VNELERVREGWSQHHRLNANWCTTRQQGRARGAWSVERGMNEEMAATVKVRVRGGNGILQF
jgi:hypothetical protein